MLGRGELDKLAVQKQTLVVESSLNRLALQAEIRNLRSATAWIREAAGRSEERLPLLLIVAPLAGFLLARLSRRPDSWLSQALAAAKWIGPLHSLWKRFSASRKQAEARQPAA